MGNPSLWQWGLKETNLSESFTISGSVSAVQAAWRREISICLIGAELQRFNYCLAVHFLIVRKGTGQLLTAALWLHLCP